MAHRGAAKMKQVTSKEILNRLSWDDLRIFLACADERSFRKAARKLGMSDSTVARRIDNLENALSARLFKRLNEGLSLTLVGNSILEDVQNMERSLYNVVRKRTDSTGAFKGPVSISITEGLGSYWVMPRLVECRKQFPFISIVLNCAMENADVLRMKADMAIQFEKPTSPDLIALRLGRLHVYAFASPEYLKIYGMPQSAEDIVNHRLVNQVAPQLDDTVWPKKLGLESLESVLSIQTNASTAHLYAVEKGAGIGALPTYVYALKAPIEPIDIDFRHELDIWLTYHPEARNTPRKSLIIDWLKDLFSPAIYPWFRDEFIHPRDLAELAPDESELPLMAGRFSAEPFGKVDTD